MAIGFCDIGLHLAFQVIVYTNYDEADGVIADSGAVAMTKSGYQKNTNDCHTMAKTKALKWPEL